MQNGVFYTQNLIEEFLREQNIRFTEVKAYPYSSKDFSVKIGKKVVKKLIITNSTFNVFNYNQEAHYDSLVYDLSDKWTAFIKNSLNEEERAKYYTFLKNELLSKIEEENEGYEDEIAYLSKKLAARKRAHKRTVVVTCEKLKALQQSFGEEEKVSIKPLISVERETLGEGLTLEK